MRNRFTVLILAAALLAGCASAPKAAPAASAAPAAAEKTVHLVGTVTFFQFIDRNKMKEVSPNVYEITLNTPAPSQESWVTKTGKAHAIKFVVNKDWKQGYINDGTGDGWSGKLVLDTGMTNIYLDLKEGTKYLYHADLNAMTYSVTEVK